MERLYGAPFRLHDVRDVEAFCSSIITKAVRLNGGTGLRYDQKRRALTDTVSLAWRLSGLDDTGRVREAWVVRAWAPVFDDETRQQVACKQRIVISEPTEERARSSLERLPERYQRPVVLHMAPPPGCYDSRKSTLSFSTFANTILTKRVVDWYRDELGDTRYGERLPVLSLDEIREREDRMVFVEELEDSTFAYETNLLLTRLAAATSVPFVSPLEEAEAANQRWVEYVDSGQVDPEREEAAA